MKMLWYNPDLRSTYGTFQWSKLYTKQRYIDFSGHLCKPVLTKQKCLEGNSIKYHHHLVNIKSQDLPQVHKFSDNQDLSQVYIIC